MEGLLPTSPGLRRILMIGLTLILLFGNIRPGLAIGPGTGGSKIRVDNEEVGPYRVLVATSPLPVTVGQMSIWIRISNVADQKMRRNAAVRIVATPRGSDLVVTAEGSHSNAGNDIDYVAHVLLEQAGQWDVTVYIDDEPGPAEVVFTESVSRGFSTGLIVGLAIPFVVLIVIVGVYFWRRAGA